MSPQKREARWKPGGTFYSLNVDNAAMELEEAIDILETIADLDLTPLVSKNFLRLTVKISQAKANIDQANTIQNNKKKE